jgi:guanylate kinase
MAEDALLTSAPVRLRRVYACSFNLLSSILFMGMRRGIIFVLSAPSGAGKTTLAREAIDQIKNLIPSVSVTTRAPRKGETEGVDYHFVSDEEFKRLVATGELAETAQVFNAWYGTPRGPLERALVEGRDVLLDIDVHGAREIARLYGQDVVRVFVIPPSFAELEARLRKRGTEDEAAVKHRLEQARTECSFYPEYDYLIVNSERASALEKLKAIVEAERLKINRLNKGFAPWT